MSLELERSIVRDKVDQLVAVLELPKSQAFLSLIFGLVTGHGFEEPSADDFTDGGDDFEIDLLNIDDSSQADTAIITVIAGTTAPNHSTTELTRMGAGLEYLLLSPREEYQKLPNEKLRGRISEFRLLRTSLGAGNVIVNCYFASLGDTKKLSRAIKNERTRIQARFSDDTSAVTLKVLGAAEIVELLQETEGKKRRVNERISIDYDTNQPSVLRHELDGISGLVCTVSAEEIARVVKKHPSIFDRNLRQYLGRRNPVNGAIYATCTNHDAARQFWFLNNGITVVCSDFALTPDPDAAFVSIQGMQIVNGCQTSSALYDAFAAKTLQKHAKVLVRIFKADTPALTQQLVITTNTQTRITARDLHANDPIQVKLQDVFRTRFGLFYERKPNEFLALSKADRIKVVSNEKVGQAYLSLVRKRPSDGGRRKYKVWGEDSAVVFYSDESPRPTF